MQEFIGFAYFAEIPAVIFDVQRGGPSTGMPTRTQQSDVTLCAYASHGDTKHVLLFPEDPKEAFEMGAGAFDLADRLQTPIFVMLDLDIGMNDRLCEPLEWDNERRFDRGKVMTEEMLNAGEEFGRYLDVDGDGIPYRTYPGTHPTKGVYFTRGTTKDQYAKYSEAGPDYIENMERLSRKFKTAANYVSPALVKDGSLHLSTSPVNDNALGIIYYGSTSPAMDEAFEQLKTVGVNASGLRIRAFPFGREVEDFVSTHERLIIVEQNRDGQLRSLLINELEINPADLTAVLHYDGTPITANFITNNILRHINPAADSNAAQVASN
jgi:2-oxoglutarate ferredoxin oxidoreductase subunit alpha